MRVVRYKNPHKSIEINNKTTWIVIAHPNSTFTTTMPTAAPEVKKLDQMKTAKVPAALRGPNTGRQVLFVGGRGELSRETL